jgi:hypothetical protein
VIRNTVNDCIRTQVALEQVADANRRRDVLFTCAGVASICCRVLHTESSKS